MSDVPPEPAVERSEPQPADPTQVRLRRAPRFGPFAATGAAVGVIIGAVLAFSTPAGDGRYSQQTALGYLCALGLMLGVLVGAGIAVLVDRRH